MVFDLWQLENSGFDDVARATADQALALVRTLAPRPGLVVQPGQSVFTRFGEFENTGLASVTLGATDPPTEASLLADGLVEITATPEPFSEALQSGLDALEAELRGDFAGDLTLEQLQTQIDDDIEQMVLALRGGAANSETFQTLRTSIANAVALLNAIDARCLATQQQLDATTLTASRAAETMTLKLSGAPSTVLLGATTSQAGVMTSDDKMALTSALQRITALEGGSGMQSIAWTDTVGLNISGSAMNVPNGTVVTITLPGGGVVTSAVTNETFFVTVPNGTPAGALGATAPDGEGGTLTAPAANYSQPPAGQFSETFVATQGIIDNGFTLAQTPVDPENTTLTGHMAGNRDADYGTEYTITGTLLEFVGDLQAVVLVGDEFTIEYTA